MALNDSTPPDHEVQIADFMARYRALKSVSSPDENFYFQLDVFQDWQIARLRNVYRMMFDDTEHRAVFDFLLVDMYRGLHISRLGPGIEGALNIVTRLIPNKTVLLKSLEVHLLTVELDEALTCYLFENLGVTEIDEAAFIEANRALNTYEKRARQIELIIELSQGVERAARSLWIYGAFKLAKGPATLCGMGEFYELLRKGFTTVRPLKDYEKTISAVMQNEHDFHQRIFDGGVAPLITFH